MPHLLRDHRHIDLERRQCLLHRRRLRYDREGSRHGGMDSSLGSVGVWVIYSSRSDNKDRKI
jgi:hypothetical protein